MTIELTFTHILTLAGLLIAGAWALGRAMVGQFTRLLDTRFAFSEEQRANEVTRSEERHARAEAALIDIGRRLSQAEIELRHVPTQREFSAITESLSGLRAANDAQTQLLQRLERQIALINEWMLENK